MCEDTFLSTYRQAFVWPVDLPVKLAPWPPPKKPCQRDLTCPPSPDPDCPCPNHLWTPHAGHYACQAERERLLHRAIQRVRREIEQVDNRKQEQDAKTKSDTPPLLRDDVKRTCYQIDFARKDVAEISFTDLLAEIEATPIPAGPLGRTLYGSYTDPTEMRKSYITRPYYDPVRPVTRQPFPDILDQYFNNYPASTEYREKYHESMIKAIKNSQKWKYPAPSIQYVTPLLPAISTK